MHRFLYGSFEKASYYSSSVDPTIRGSSSSNSNRRPVGNKRPLNPEEVEAMKILLFFSSFSPSFFQGGGDEEAGEEGEALPSC